MLQQIVMAVMLLLVSHLSHQITANIVTFPAGEIPKLKLPGLMNFKKLESSSLIINFAKTIPTLVCPLWLNLNFVQVSQTTMETVLPMLVKMHAKVTLADH